jgi:hypothetical protein
MISAILVRQFIIRLSATTKKTPLRIVKKLAVRLLLASVLHTTYIFKPVGIYFRPINS